MQAFFVLLFVIALPMTPIATETSFENLYENIDSLINTATVIEDKVYIQSANIHFSENQIYVKIAEAFIPVKQICCDGDGIFIPILDIRAGCARQGTWICPICGYENYDIIRCCGICGYDRYENE